MHLCCLSSSPWSCTVLAQWHLSFWALKSFMLLTYLRVFGGSTWAGFNGKTIEPPQAGSTELAVQILPVVRTLLISVLDTHFVWGWGKLWLWYYFLSSFIFWVIYTRWLAVMCCRVSSTLSTSWSTLWTKAQTVSQFRPNQVSSYICMHCTVNISCHPNIYLVHFALISSHKYIWFNCIVVNKKSKSQLPLTKSLNMMRSVR